MRSIARKYGFEWRARVNIADGFDPEFRKGKTMGLRIERWICLTAVLVTLSSLALAQGAGHPDKGPNPDEPAIHDYVLTMDKIKKYADVTKRLEAAAKSDPAMAAEMKKIEEADVYNVDKAAVMEKSPRLAAALHSYDITARDFVLTPLTAFTAAIGIAAEDAKKQPPAYINPPNIKFVRDHKEELEKLNLFEPALDKSSPDKRKEEKEEDKPDDQ
jgi:hypothetical protein